MNEQNVKIPSVGLAGVGFPGWPAGNRPPNPAVIVAFAGLIGFGYSRSYGRAEIVFNDGDARHNLTITASQDGAPIDLKPKLPTPITKIELGLSQRPDVHFLKDGSTYDFGYVLDLNGPEWYPGKGIKDQFGIKMIVNHGTFFTSSPTHFQFAREIVPPIPWPPALGARIGQFYADVVTDEIGAVAGGVVSLIVNDTLVESFPADPGRRAEILFDNLCREDGRLCDHRPSSWIEKERSDFHFHRDVLDLSILDLRRGLTIGAGQLTEDGFEIATGRIPTSNDLAPCMVGGYGNPDGLPPSA